MIPRGTRLGRNVKVGYDVKTADFRQRVVKTGGTIEPSERGARAAARGSRGVPVMDAGPSGSRNGSDGRGSVPSSTVKR